MGAIDLGPQIKQNEVRRADQSPIPLSVDGYVVLCPDVREPCWLSRSPCVTVCVCGFTGIFCLDSELEIRFPSLYNFSLF